MFKKKVTDARGFARGDIGGFDIDWYIKPVF